MAPASVRVKVCGITTSADAVAAARAGVDAIGLNFVAGPRRIDADQARSILDALPAAVEVWALAQVSGGDLPEEVRGIVFGSERITHVQMYGPVQPATPARLADRGLKAVAVRHVADDGFVEQTAAWLTQCHTVSPDLVLLDAAGPLPGGSGRVLNWEMIAAQKRAGRLDGWPPLVLAGGLTPGNVAQAVRIVSPLAVDVSSGVEQSPGRKDPDKLAAFVQAAKAQQP